VVDAQAVPSDGYRVIRFIEKFCRLTKGKRAGELISLFDFQRELITGLYAVDPVTGRRLYPRGLIGMPRKNGKSMIGAALALYGLAFDGENGAEVYSVAGAALQARIVFTEARRMVQLSPDLSRVLTVYRNEIVHKPSGSVYRAISAEAYSAEGLNPSLVIFDEVHVQPDESLWNVMSLGSAARDQPLILGITTAGWDMNTLCGRLYQMGRAGQTPGFYFKWWEPADPACDYRDPAVWRETNPGLVAGFLREDDFVTAVEQSTENTVRRYRLNQFTSSTERALPFGVWDGLADPGRELLAGEDIAFGFDGSFNGDSTALVACTADGWLHVLGAWEHDGTADWKVDIAEVEATIREMATKYRPREIAMDPFRWSRTMEALEAEGLPIVAWPTTSAVRMVPAWQRFYDGCMQASSEQRVSHDGSEALARHVSNMIVKTDRLGPRVVKEHKGSPKHIDLAIAAIIAHDRATRPGEVDPPPNVF
jgi:phage terminase large subunit-like protein